MPRVDIWMEVMLAYSRRNWMAWGVFYAGPRAKSVN
jgi:hypothetical protein